MKDNWRALFCLAELERQPAGVKTDTLHRLLAESGLKPPVMRTLQRDIEALRKRNFTLTRRRRSYSLEPTEANRRAFFQLLREFSLSKQGAPFFYGSIDVARSVDYFASRTSVIALIFELLQAMRSARTVYFEYTPQSDITRMRMSARARYQATDKRIIPVRMLPHRLVSGGNSFLVLGEFYEKKGFYKDQYKSPVVRHYELRGIEKLSVGEEQNKKLDIKPEEVYRNSVHIWAGGREYELELEELWYDGGKPHRRKRKVNGEDEVLSLAAGSLGRIKIVNPPDPLRQRARQIGLPEKLVFRFDEQSASQRPVS
jgi:hypothetical protein